MVRDEFRKLEAAIGALQEEYERPISDQVVHNHAHCGVKRIEALTLAALRRIRDLLTVAFADTDDAQGETAS